MTIKVQKFTYFLHKINLFFIKIAYSENLASLKMFSLFFSYFTTSNIFKNLLKRITFK